VQVRDMDFCYGSNAALHGIKLDVEYHRVTALIGPSGCGKSTLLRCINRMNDRVAGARVSKGEILVKGKNIHDADVDLTQLRKQVGMVFQKSNPFPKTIYENVAYGLRVHGVKDKTSLDEAVERSLTQAALWDELKDRLQDHALGLSGGQQQRLCIARAIATMPDVLLMDEPCSALDPIATLKIEELITQLSRDYTVVIVTHNMQQAVRVSDFTAFLHLGKLVEFAPTEELFTNPREKLTDSYLRGTFS
jgi:phosphate transport system ATP-binding protein